MSEVHIVEWDDRFSVGIPLVDDQHRGLVKMTNDLYTGCRLGDDAARAFFLKTIHEAVDYVKLHFDTEEKILRKISYPDYSVHKKQHEDFVMEVLNEVKNFQDGKKFVPNTFVRFLRDWVLTHIAVSDKQYADYIIQLKKQGKLQSKA
ncbi:bacteriohemerythrin [Breznakiella homolactica]|uniref:Hemerythrin family protein n=1 Tax=Breznakiella homolactica TaxID=2798577 RepID=A0A7T7XMJ1_9SPIR|nr:bacteriohemerythrin [Breznakiella homolactica]QQO09105.1 bacteriohemerythrin [Breznakiella homolactica]